MNEENKHLDNETSAEITKAIRNIKIAWIAGVLVGILGIIVFILQLKSAKISELWPQLSFSPSMFGFSYGIYRKSRVCSIIVLAIFAIFCVAYVIHGIFISALFAAIICIPFYIGLMGTFKYHKLNETMKKINA